MEEHKLLKARRHILHNHAAVIPTHLHLVTTASSHLCCKYRRELSVLFTSALGHVLSKLWK
eukprot:26179-Eustigmatos_ZCMA.PRE.1